ncbi:MAG: hypothetical protein F6K11_14305 [Leptolyngbya sp. SIO3F4]|nr:hypothetical protein [Leptolyngbya sp. SIO3F4]
MWIISTILEGGDLETAIRKAVTMKAKRPSHLPAQGFLLTMLSRINNQVPEVQGSIDVRVIESSQVS